MRKRGKLKNKNLFDSLQEITEKYEKIFEPITLLNQEILSNSVYEISQSVSKIIEPTCNLLPGYNLNINSPFERLNTVMQSHLQNHTIDIHKSFGCLSETLAMNVQVNNTELINNITTVLESISNQSLTYMQSLISDISFNALGNLVYDDVEYTNEDLEKELKSQIEDVQYEKPFKESDCEIKGKYGLLNFLYKFISVIVTLNALGYSLTGTDYISECKQLIEQAITGENKIVYVNKEKADLREEADSYSFKIGQVLYAVELEVIEDVPYWYKVKYIENDEEKTGWIAKINVEEK